MLKYILGLLSLFTYFGTPILYIFEYHLKGNTEEKYSFVWIFILFLVILFIIFILTKLIFKIKKIYYLKLFIITIEILGVLYCGILFFKYISFNANDIENFLFVCMISTSIGIIPTIFLLRNLHKEEII